MTCIKETGSKYTFYGARAAKMQIRLVYMYLLNVPCVSSRYFNKIKTNVSFREIARLIARNSLIIVKYDNSDRIVICAVSSKHFQ